MMSDRFIESAWETAESLRRQVLLQCQAHSYNHDDYLAWQRAVKEAKDTESLWASHDGILAPDHDMVREYGDDGG